MLAEVEPHGLPGTRIEGAAFQRASEGHPLGDVVVCGTTPIGDPTILEVQAKRTITFAPSDPVFRDVVEQIVRALPTLDFAHDRHQLAVATSRMSAKITGPYQDVLLWAREVGDAPTFMARLSRPKVGNDAMRGFVGSLRTHLSSFGASDDDETVWNILRRFHILVFDFTATASQSREHDLERRRFLLRSADAGRANALWSALVEMAIRTAASGGDRNLVRLRSDLSTAGFHLKGSRRNHAARTVLADDAGHAAAGLRRGLATAVAALRDVQGLAAPEAEPGLLQDPADAMAAGGGPLAA